MKVKIDADTCIGCGLCVNACPEVYKMEEDKAVVIGTSVSPAAEAPPRILVTVPQAAGVKVKVVSLRASPLGKLSLTLLTVRAPGLSAGLARVRASTVVPPSVMLLGEKLLVTAGGT